MLLLALLFIAVSSFILMTRAPTVTLTRYSMITCLDQVNHEIKGYEYDCPDNNYTNNTVPVNINSH